MFALNTDAGLGKALPFFLEAERSYSPYWISQHAELTHRCWISEVRRWLCGLARSLLLHRFGYAIEFTAGSRETATVAQVLSPNCRIVNVTMPACLWVWPCMSSIPEFDQQRRRTVLLA